MKVITPQISWHSQEPLLSVDFSRSGRLATGSTDHSVKIWYISVKDDNVSVTYASSLDRHEKPVNIARFSHSGDVLATAGDDAVVFLWRLKADVKPFGEDEKECWFSEKLPQKHSADVYDLCWFRDGTGLVTASVDNSAIVWDVAKVAVHDKLDEHSHFVQGVAVDPQGTYVATLSCDRTCRIYSPAKHKKYRCVKVLQWLQPETDTAPPAANAAQSDSDANKSIPSRPRLFRDENVKSFVRRPEWSPDGAVLVIPTGQFQADASSAIVNTTFVFARNDFNRPIVHLPGISSPSVCVRFNPCFFHLRRETDSPEPWLKVPYRMVFAVATLDEVLVYDTQHTNPIACARGLHYQSITDLSWNSDGQLLAASSADGYISFFIFAAGELGSMLNTDEMATLVPIVAAGVSSRTQQSEPEPAQPVSTADAISEPVLAQTMQPSAPPEASSLAEQKLEPSAGTAIAPAPSNGAVAEAGTDNQQPPTTAGDEQPKKRRVALEVVQTYQ